MPHRPSRVSASASARHGHYRLRRRIASWDWSGGSGAVGVCALQATAQTLNSGIREYGSSAGGWSAGWRCRRLPQWKGGRIRCPSGCDHDAGCHDRRSAAGPQPHQLTGFHADAARQRFVHLNHGLRFGLGERGDAPGLRAGLILAQQSSGGEVVRGSRRRAVQPRPRVRPARNGRGGRWWGSPR